MSLAIMAVGLGNVWRFSYLVGTYGDGAFVFAYLVCLCIIVLPLYLVECALGNLLGILAMACLFLRDPQFATALVHVRHLFAYAVFCFFLT